MFKLKVEKCNDCPAVSTSLCSFPRAYLVFCHSIENFISYGKEKRFRFVTDIQEKNEIIEIPDWCHWNKKFGAKK